MRRGLIVFLALSLVLTELVMITAKTVSECVSEMDLDPDLEESSRNSCGLRRELSGKRRHRTHDSNARMEMLRGWGMY